MIVLNLLCDNGHRSEGWFASREAYADQARRGLVQCSLCASTSTTAMPSGPRVRRQARDEGSPATPVMAPAQAAARQLFGALAEMARRAEDVGERFPEEARRIHYHEVPARTIRGVASAEETRALLEEGVPVLPAPVPPERETH